MTKQSRLYRWRGSFTFFANMFFCRTLQFVCAIVKNMELIELDPGRHLLFLNNNKYMVAQSG